MQYAGFWRRFGAYWIDFAVFIPITVLTYVLGETTRLFHLYWFVPGLAIGLAFNVYLVRRYGGTPGKLLVKTRIAMLDGSPVTTAAAMLRYSVLFVIVALTNVGLIMGSLAMTDDAYFSLGFAARSHQLAALAPAWFPPLTVLVQIWIWSEFVTLLFNKKRRAIHDFIAGTIVVRTDENPANESGEAVDSAR